MKEVQIYNRTLEKARQLVTSLNKHCHGQTLAAHQLRKSDISNNLHKAALLVNTTPVGMFPAIEQCPLEDNVSIPSTLIVMDLIYNPLKTKLLKNAEKAGAHTISGLDMLIYQGLESLSIWTKQSLDIEKLFFEARQVLVKKLTNNTANENAV